MTITELEQAILDVFRNDYEVEYIGKLTVKKEKNGAYTAIFGLNNVDKPMTISAQLNEVDFIKYIKSEFRERGINRWNTQYFLGYKTYKEPCKDELQQILDEDETY